MSDVALAERHETRLAELLELKENWDSYKARPIDPACVARARPLIAELEAIGMTPWITPLQCGGLMIERGGTDDYSIEIRPDDKADFYVSGTSDHVALTALRFFADRQPIDCRG